MLSAISLAESGRTLNGRRVAWPWTINADGRGYYFSTKAEAVAAARSLRQAGAGNLDIGCMQISLKHHPRAFADLEMAFDPAANVAYAGRFLSSLLKAHGGTAVGRYHSATPALRDEYQRRVEGIWRRLRTGQPIRVGWTGGGGTAVSSPLPDYPDAAMRTVPPLRVRDHYQERMSLRPGDPVATFGWAVATERMARLRLVPYSLARVAYARALRADRGNRAALGRLLELTADETPERQLEVLEDAFRLAGGPAELALRLAEVAESQGNPGLAGHYRGQAETLRRMGETVEGGKRRR